MTNNPSGLMNSRFRGLLSNRSINGRLLSLFDRNKDGRLEQSELPERMRMPLMTFADTNNDDAIDKDELTTAFKQLEQIQRELTK